MEAASKTIDKNTVLRRAERYRLNRRAALSMSAVFLTLASAAGGFCMYRMQPQRRTVAVRENADRAIQTGQHRRAAIELGNLVRLTPDDVDAWLKLARVHLKILEETAANAGNDSVAEAASRDRLRLAVAAFRRAAELRPDLPEPQRWLLELHLRGGNWADARCRLDVVQRLTPADPLVGAAWEMLPTEFAAEATLARNHLASSRPAAAATLLEPLLETRPADWELVELYAQATTLLHRPDRCQHALAAARSIVGDSPRLDLIEARCHWLLGNLDSAESLIDRAKRSALTELPARRLHADILKLRAETSSEVASAYWNQALAEYREVLERAPVDQDTAIEIASLLGSKLGRVQEAVDVAAAMLERTERPSARLLGIHGWLLLRCGRASEAAASLRRATERGPIDWEAHSRLLVAEVACGRLPASPIWPAFSNTADRFGAMSYSESLLPGVVTPAVATGEDGNGGAAARLVRRRGQQ